MEAKINKPVYLDYNATTPLDKRVLESMMPALKQNRIVIEVGENVPA